MSCSNNSLNIVNKESSTQSVKQHQTKVLTLGTFHFNFPNRDVAKINKDDQIDVLEPKYQKEIELLVEKLAKFNPTRIAIEVDPCYQSKYDSLYIAYLDGNYALSRNEDEQIGFRLAKKLNLSHLDCVNEWEFHYDYLTKTLTDPKEKEKFLNYFYDNPDRDLKQSSNTDNRLFKTDGIIAELKRINSESFLTRDLGDYLLGIFKYETQDNPNFGVDFTTGWWFNRNLKIFRNIQRLNAKQDDRILVIYGSGHMDLLNIFFKSSPEFELLDVNDFLN